jgi:hypothetical protein
MVCNSIILKRVLFHSKVAYKIQNINIRIKIMSMVVNLIKFWFCWERKKRKMIQWTCNLIRLVEWWWLFWFSVCEKHKLCKWLSKFGTVNVKKIKKILLKQVRWCLTFVGLYNIYTCKLLDIFNMEERTFTVMLLAIVTPLRQSIIA